MTLHYFQTISLVHLQSLWFPAKPPFQIATLESTQVLKIFIRTITISRVADRFSSSAAHGIGAIATGARSSSMMRPKFPVLISRVHVRSPHLQVNGEGCGTQAAQAARGNTSLCLSLQTICFYSNDG
jgi:hypothetical protein